jgi:ABC-type lipoprotein release transport system permease subunit
MRLYLRLAWRNLWRHWGRTIIVVLAISLTLAMMLLYDGLVAGFENAIYGNAIRVLGGNIQIHAVGYAESASTSPLLPLPAGPAEVDAALKQPQVLGASLRINTGGLATNSQGAFGVGITGIQPEQEAQLSLIAQHVTAGRYLQSGDQDMAFIGQGLATAMGLQVGDRFTLAGKAAHQQMRQRTMTVVGIYDIGMKDIEKGTVYLSLGEAQSLYGLDGQATEAIITLKQIGGEAAVINALKPLLTGVEFSSWQTNFPDLNAAIGTKGAAMDIFNVIIMLIAGIGILNLLVMAVYERTREIGLLGALGLRPGQISVLFVLEGTMMGLVGAAAGILLGLLINFALGKVGFDYSAFSSLTSYTALINSRVYPTLGLAKIPGRTLIVLIITSLAALIPAREAGQREPAEALHYV